MKISTLEQVRKDFEHGVYNMTENRKCTIYSVRLAICRCFICSEPNRTLKHKELWNGVRKPVNVREIFYGKD